MSRGESVEIASLETPCLGNRSYIAIADGEAAVIDPPRDIDRVEEIVESSGAQIRIVAETHRHADYVSGGLELARRHRANYVVPTGDPQPRFSFTSADDDQRHPFGSGAVRVMATPGHTPHHVSYVLEDAAGPTAVCTGGSLLHGSVGRTDLYGPDVTRPLAHAQWRSARRLVSELPPEVRLLPTHGFGSLCSVAGTAPTDGGTLGAEHESNPALVLAEHVFVASLIDGYGPIPRHYGRLPLLNAAGPSPVDLSAARALAPADLDGLRRSGHWLVDVRDRKSFARAHLRGSVNVEATGPLVAYLPWILPPGAGVVLLGDEASVASAARQLTQVGIDRPVGVAVGGPADWAGPDATAVSDYSVSDFPGLMEAMASGTAVPLDVRSRQEWIAGHVRHALHLSLPDLADIADPSSALPSVNVAGEVWVYCGGGFRAAVAASLLDATGARVTLIDQPYQAAVAEGLTVVDTRRDDTADPVRRSDRLALP